MPVAIGEIESLHLYPVKSMRGERTESAELGWHGLVGDRRLAVHRTGDRAGFPWLTASRLPELLLYTPVHDPGAARGTLPGRVRTPEGLELDTFGAELAADIARRHGAAVEMLHLNRGIFDEAPISILTSATVTEVSRLADCQADVRRFRPNLVIATRSGAPFDEDAWLGATLAFGAPGQGAALLVTQRDERCAMVNFDPDTASPSPRLLKTIVSERGNDVGVYATIVRRGHVTVGQTVYLESPASESAQR